jgi:hypothetical protein
LSELNRSGRSPFDATGTSLDASSPSLPAATANAAPYQPPTAIASLTGGDPAPFCAAIGPFVRTMAGWSLADLSKPSAAAGLPALTFGPLVARELRTLRPSTPDELLVQFSAASAQADAAVGALRQAGLTTTDIEMLADTASQQLEGPNPDSALVEQQLVDGLGARLGRDAVVSLAASFDQLHPTAAAVFDLGEISPAVLESSDYGCLATAFN